MADISLGPTGPALVLLFSLVLRYPPCSPCCSRESHLHDRTSPQVCGPIRRCVIDDDVGKRPQRGEKVDSIHRLAWTPWGLRPGMGQLIVASGAPLWCLRHPVMSRRDNPGYVLSTSGRTRQTFISARFLPPTTGHSLTLCYNR